MNNPLPPLATPCGSCPYRRDVPSGVWEESEYDKLVAYDGPTYTQPPAMFDCHQATGHLCAGWVGVHDMYESLSVRLAATSGQLDPETVGAVLGYTTSVPLFESGAAAAAHGKADVDAPSEKALRVIDKVRQRIR